MQGCADAFGMPCEVSLLFPLVLRLQGRGAVDTAQEFQMVAELMAQDAPQDPPGFGLVRQRVCAVKRAFVHDDLPDAGEDLVQPPGI